MSYENALQLPTVLQQIHRDSAVKVLQSHGYMPEGWDQAVAEQLTAYAVPGYDLSTVSYRAAGSLAGNSQPYVPVSSAVPEDYRDMRPESQSSLLDDVLSPVRVVRVNSPQADASGPDINIYCLPDSPPIAVREDTLHLVWKRRYYSSALRIGTDFNLIPFIDSQLGDRPAEFLDDDACGSLIKLLKIMRHRCINFEGF